MCIFLLGSIPLRLLIINKRSEVIVKAHDTFIVLRFIHSFVHSFIHSVWLNWLADLGSFRFCQWLNVRVSNKVECNYVLVICVTRAQSIVTHGPSSGSPPPPTLPPPPLPPPPVSSDGSNQPPEEEEEKEGEEEAKKKKKRKRKAKERERKKQQSLQSQK